MPAAGRSPAVPAAAADAGTAATAAICRGARPTTRTTSSSPRSCCSRRRSIACCRSTPSGSTSTRRSRRWPAAPEQDVTADVVSARLQHPAEAAADDRARGRSRTTAAQLPSDEETLLSFKGIGAYTAGAIRSFAFRERAAILDTNVARVLFRVFVGEGRSEEPRDEAAPLGASRKRVVPHAPRLRLQPGADGLRRDGLRRAEPEVPGLPDGEELPRRTRSTPDATMTTIVVAAAVIERDGRFLVTRRQRGVHLEGFWEFPGGKCEPGETLRGVPGARAARGARRRRRRRRRRSSRRRTSIRTGGRAALLPVRAARRAAAAARSGDALGAPRASWRRWSSRRPTRS